MDEEDELISLAKVSKRMGIPRSTLRYAARTGRLWSVREESEFGTVYKTTIKAVKEWQKTPKMGRPRKKS